MRVVIAEDLVLLRQSIARLLEQHGIEVVAQAGDAAALVDAVVAHRPDLVIADVRMPPTFTDEGARAALMLRDRYPDLAVLMLSHIVEPALAMRLAGGRPASFGYLLKDRVLDLDDFVAAVERVVGGGTAIDRQVIDHYLVGTSLSGREREVLGLLAQGLSNQAIARHLVLSERTVDTHLASIFVKLGLPQDGEHNRRVRATLMWLRNRS
ncbi:response regulator transcription factor [Nonomuraea soli]|uniref:DNA-binding NarL/FixJ family response regulator n=1 Tax=Nonomuraea soli TaxID=1032476 RepID=A0A7W0CKS7_9ACTN|nr:response regulator transcription factor [Nonomuraea soli]MBA2892775.1 DNA-binding NarL/FixJ family response regulator [Nonomuraea soli]